MGVEGIDYIVEDGIKWDIGTGYVIAKRPNEVLPFCGGGKGKEYDPNNDCNVTNAIYDLALSYARERGEDYPTDLDYRASIEKIGPRFRLL